MVEREGCPWLIRAVVNANSMRPSQLRSTMRKVDIQKV